jgi:cytochrome b561
MQWRNSSERYGAVTLAFHWITAIVVSVTWLLGQGMDLLPRGNVHTAGVFTHIALGLLVLAILIFRIVWRWVERRPSPVPSRLGRWSVRLAESVHYLLYGLLFAVTAMGMLHQFAAGGLPILGLVDIPSPIVEDKALARNFLDVHAILANTIMVVAGFHAAAALAHHYLFRDSTLRRMLPTK